MQIALLELGRPLSNRETVSLDRLARRLLEFYEPVFEGNELEARASIKPSAIPGGQQLLEQMISNLIENAVKFARKEDG